MNFRCPNEKSINLFSLNLVVTGIKTIVTSIKNLFLYTGKKLLTFLFSPWTFRIINDVVFVYIMIKYEHVIFVGLQHVILFLNESFEALIFICLRRVLLEMASLVFISKFFSLKRFNMKKRFVFLPCIELFKHPWQTRWLCNFAVYTWSIL